MLIIAVNDIELLFDQTKKDEVSKSKKLCESFSLALFGQLK